MAIILISQQAYKPGDRLGIASAIGPIAYLLTNGTRVRLPINSSWIRRGGDHIYADLNDQLRFYIDLRSL